MQYGVMWRFRGPNLLERFREVLADNQLAVAFIVFKVESFGPHQYGTLTDRLVHVVVVGHWSIGQREESSGLKTREVSQCGGQITGSVTAKGTTEGYRTLHNYDKPSD